MTDHTPEPDPTIDPTVKAGGDSEGLGMKQSLTAAMTPRLPNIEPSLMI